jgi:hypothetical protein
MFDLPGRLVVAYGLIALVVLAAAAFAFWRSRNTQAIRDGKARVRLEERYRVRDEARTEDQSAER